MEGWLLEAELVGTPAFDTDEFGRSIALSGNTLVVGARHAEPDEVGAGSDAGAVYIFVRLDGAWAQEAKIEFVDQAPSPTFFFGKSVAISGDTVVVGASDDTSSYPPDNAKAYVYNRTSGSWRLQQELLVAAPDKQIGTSVAVSGDLLLAGYLDGGVYSFAQEGGVWTEEQFIPSNGDGSCFGRSLAIVNDLAAIGDFGAGPTESVSVFERVGGVWEEKEMLFPSDLGLGWKHFGSSIAIAEETIFVGAPKAEAVYVFTSSLGVWAQQQKLVASEPSQYKGFGIVAASEDRLVVGAPGDDERGFEIGAAYVFTKSDGAWSEERKMTPARDTGRSDRMGASISVSGHTAIFGMPGDYERTREAGAVYVFENLFGAWIPRQKLTASDGDSSTGFGRLVALSGDNLMVVADNGPPPHNSDSNGILYFFRRNLDGSWSERQRIFASGVSSRAGFGSAIAIEGEMAFVGAAEDIVSNKDSGSVCVYVRANNVWSMVQKFGPSDGARYDLFGSALATSGNTLIVGAPRKGNWKGAAYTFTKSGGVWAGEQKLDFPLSWPFDSVGNSVCIQDDTAIVSAPGYGNTTFRNGAVYSFSRVNGMWVETQMLVQDNGVGGNQFGRDVSLSRGKLVVTAAKGGEPLGGTPSSAAYVFDSSGGSWSLSEKLTATSSDLSSFDGSELFLSGETIFLHAVDGLDPNSGAVYVYSPPVVSPSAASDSWTLFE